MAWKDDEISALISIWGDDIVQAQLEGCKRNKLVYEKVSESMKKVGFERSAVQCREKAKKVKSEYRKIKDKHRVTGTGRKKWKHYEALDAVLGDRPTTVPPFIVDTLQESTSDTEMDNSEENESIVTVTTECSDEQSRKSPSYDNQMEPSSSKSVPKTKILKKKNIGHWVEKVVEAMTEKLIAATAESDKRFVELEEKRMKFEKEERDREERQRKEDRDFQLQVFRMLCSVNQVHFIFLPKKSL